MNVIHKFIEYRCSCRFGQMQKCKNQINGTKIVHDVFLIISFALSVRDLYLEQ